MVSVWHKSEFEDAKQEDVLAPVEEIAYSDGESVLELIESFRLLAADQLAEYEG